MNSIVNNYTDSYVAFLDVLGFKEMVFKNDDQLLTTYFNTINTVIDDLKKRDQKINLKHIVISDSIILSMEKEQGKNFNVNALRQLCIAVKNIQAELAIHNIWLRGAISSGKTYFDQENNQIIGPAFINAYLLEEEIAIFPRVILDNKLLFELNYNGSDEFINAINTGTYSEIALYDWSKNIFIGKYSFDQDVPFFIDYLEGVFSDDYKFNVISNNIKNGMYANSKVYKKYRWVANYLYSIYLREENKIKYLRFKEILEKI